MQRCRAHTGLGSCCCATAVAGVLVTASCAALETQAREASLRHPRAARCQRSKQPQTPSSCHSLPVHVGLVGCGDLGQQQQRHSPRQARIAQHWQAPGGVAECDQQERAPWLQHPAICNQAERSHMTICQMPKRLVCVHNACSSTLLLLLPACKQVWLN